MGNSEVGHICIGAGRVVRTSFCKLHDSIKKGDFFKNEFLIEKLKSLKKKDKSLHVMGLLSDAGVHGHEDHIYAILKLAKSMGVKKTFIHAFLDGRDTPPKSAKEHIKKLQNLCEAENYGVIASIHGRFYAMDRDNNWERTKKSYDVISGLGDYVDSSWESVIDKSYAKNITDEFIEPVLLVRDGAVKDGDGLFFTNFRPDRARQLTKCFLDEKKVSFFISTVQYDKVFRKNKIYSVLFENEEIKNTLLDEIASQTKDLENNRVFIIAETEKYAHVTYFFRGKVDLQLENETRILVPSKKVRTYENDPEMSAKEITGKILESLKSDPAYFYLVNYANCDMVGHSGNFDATVKACEYIDEQLKILYEEVVEKLGGTIFITGDHGNAEEMALPGNKPKTSHTTNPVPFVIVDKKLKGDYPVFEDQNRGLSAVKPTILQHLGL
jgi:2,3-bisphosphoglycerate-independent phosphoglycerate mutase